MEINAIALLLKNLRQISGWSVEQLAEKVGLQKSLIDDVENGKEDYSCILHLISFYGLDAEAAHQGMLQNEMAATVFLFHNDKLVFDIRDSSVFKRAICDARQNWIVYYGSGNIPVRLTLAPRDTLASHATEAAYEGYGLAWELRCTLGLGCDPVGDMQELLEQKLGVFAYQADLFSSGFRAGAVLDSQRHAAAVVLASGDRGYAHRVELAHELCHLLFDETQGKVLIALDGEQSGASKAMNEARAKGFAAEFLLPRQGIEQIINRGIPPESMVSQVRQYFQASWEVTVWHLHNLGWYKKDVALRLLYSKQSNDEKGMNLPVLPAAQESQGFMSDVIADLWVVVEAGLRTEARDWVQKKLSEAREYFSQGKNIRGASILSLAVNEAIQEGRHDKIEALLKIEPSSLPEDGVMALLDATRGGFRALPQRKLYAEKAHQALMGSGWSEKDIQSIAGLF